MAFAGPWDRSKWPDSTVQRTFTISTTNANSMMTELHDRMPVILGSQDWPAWFGEIGSDRAALMRPVCENVLKV
jgi:putative SOS response-associated peptidase YedK